MDCRKLRVQGQMWDRSARAHAGRPHRAEQSRHPIRLPRTIAAPVARIVTAPAVAPGSTTRAAAANSASWEQEPRPAAGTASKWIAMVPARAAALMEAVAAPAAAAPRSFPGRRATTAAPWKDNACFLLANSPGRSCDCHLLCGIKYRRSNVGLYQQAVHSINTQSHKIRSGAQAERIERQRTGLRWVRLGHNFLIADEQCGFL